MSYEQENQELASSDEENEAIRDREEIEEIMKKYKVNSRISIPIRKVEEPVSTPPGKDYLCICIRLPLQDNLSFKSLSTIFSLYSSNVKDFDKNREKAFLYYSYQQYHYCFLLYNKKLDDVDTELKILTESLGMIIKWTLNTIGFNIKHPNDTIVYDYPKPSKWKDCRKLWQHKKVPEHVDDEICLLYGSKLVPEAVIINMVSSWCESNKAV